MKCNLSV